MFSKSYLTLPGTIGKDIMVEFKKQGRTVKENEVDINRG